MLTLGHTGTQHSHSTVITWNVIKSQILKFQLFVTMYNYMSFLQRRTIVHIILIYSFLVDKNIGLKKLSQSNSLNTCTYIVHTYVFNLIRNEVELQASDGGVLPSFVCDLVSIITGCLHLSPGRVHVSLRGPARVICIHQRVNWLRHSWHRDAKLERRF